MIGGRELRVGDLVEFRESWTAQPGPHVVVAAGDPGRLWISPTGDEMWFQFTAWEDRLRLLVPVEERVVEMLMGTDRR